VVAPYLRLGLHSYPTRRSSDLSPMRRRRWAEEGARSRLSRRVPLARARGTAGDRPRMSDCSFADTEGPGTDAVLREVLADVLGLAPERVAAFTPETGLFGELPELDSMAGAGLLTELDDRLGVVIAVENVDGAVR